MEGEKKGGVRGEGEEEKWVMTHESLTTEARGDENLDALRMGQ